MTVTIRNEKIGNYSISIEQEKYSVAYHVLACKVYDNGLARAIDDRLYTTRTQANRRFNILKKRALSGDL